MPKIIVRVTVAICALGLGVAASSFVNRCRTPEVTAKGIPELELKHQQEIVEGWKRVEINDRFSFYLPPDVKPIEFPGDTHGPAGAFCRSFTFF